MRDHEWPLERQQPADHQRFEEERIGHPVDPGGAKIRIEQRPFRTGGNRRALDAKRALRARRSPTRALVPGRRRFVRAGVGAGVRAFTSSAARRARSREAPGVIARSSNLIRAVSGIRR